MTGRPARAMLALTVSLLLIPALSKAQVISNPSFEDVQIGSPFVSSNSADVPGWTHTGGGDGPLWHIGYSDGGGSITVAGQGNQFVTMGGGGTSGTSSWSQVVSGFTPGATYTLGFMMASENTSLAQSLTVDFPTGSSTAAQAFSAPASSANYWRNWVAKSMNFVPSASSVTLRFTATTQFDVGLDNVSVALAPTVPEPGCFALLVGTGVPGAAFWLRRRKSRR